MIKEIRIPEPLVFNPFKHYLPFQRDFIAFEISNLIGRDSKYLIRELKHLGTSVMDVYTGYLSLEEIFKNITEFLRSRDLLSKELFAPWVGTNFNNFKITSLPDGSMWTLKYHEDNNRFVHLFPARLSPHTLRVKSNTLKSAILYLIHIGKDYITGDDLNRARALSGLSPVKGVAETEAVIEMIEILRS